MCVSACMHPVCMYLCSNLPDFIYLSTSSSYYTSYQFVWNDHLRWLSLLLCCRCHKTRIEGSVQISAHRSDSWHQTQSCSYKIMVILNRYNHSSHLSIHYTCSHVIHSSIYTWLPEQIKKTQINWIIRLVPNGLRF